ncbi:putative aldouronate transport system permease protein [Paenibacillus endophyticus]|uniref:Putative aldouronate transport system permease protein n=1 Tax=Paenibacillus endophyticus TaxID=1294268 RepID=A0A7W5CAV1_9BACL|nr:carbohydrate ABC transporter permease [Paenibacillus endophyticus]MBB3154192.1 putative aldouronate transport system permease protein [Paenibacillus endophyticus]
MISIKRKTTGDVLFDVVNYTLLIGFMLMILYPLYFILIASFSDPNRVGTGDVWLIPQGITFEGYQRIFNDGAIWLGYRNSLLYAVLSAFIGTSLAIMAAYPLSRKDFYGRNAFMLFFAVTLFFNGGLIPTYLLMRNMHLMDTIWPVVLLPALDAFVIIIARTFFQGLPEEIRESASMDGCTNMRYIWSFVLPLSKPIIAVLALFAIVKQWNGFFDALIYLKDEATYPLQLILRNILIQNQPTGNLLSDIQSAVEQQRIVGLIKYGVIIVAALPLLILYPFLQRYFVQGVFIGSVKG